MWEINVCALFDPHILYHPTCLMASSMMGAVSSAKGSAPTGKLLRSRTFNVYGVKLWVVKKRDFL